MEEKIALVLENGYKFKFDLAFTKGWELFKKGAGGFIGFTLLLMVMCFVLIFIPIVGILSLPFVGLALTAGYFIYAESLQRDEQTFGDFFKGFSFLGQLIMYMLLYLLLMIPYFVLYFSFVLPYGLLLDLFSEMFSGNFDDLEGLIYDLQAAQGSTASTVSYLVSMAYSYYISTSLYLALPLIINGGLSATKAIKASWQIVSKNFFYF